MNYPSDKINYYPNLKIVEDSFDKETGFCIVTVAAPEGRFTGTARVHPYDLEHRRFNTRAGYYIAHARALLQYVKHQKQLEEYLYQELNKEYAHMKKKSDAAELIKERLATALLTIAYYDEAIKDLNDILKSKINGLEEYYTKRDNTPIPSLDNKTIDYAYPTFEEDKNS